FDRADTSPGILDVLQRNITQFLEDLIASLGIKGTAPVPEDFPSGPGHMAEAGESLPDSRERGQTHHLQDSSGGGEGNGKEDRGARKLPGGSSGWGEMPKL